MQRFLIISLLAVLAFSCTEKIDLQLAQLNEPVLIVDATIDDRSTADTVILNYSSNYYEGGLPEAETNALVTVTYNDSVYVFTHLVEKPGYYISPVGFSPQPNALYVLNINAKGKLYSGSSYMYPVPTIDSIGQRRLDEDLFVGGGQIELTISFQDPPNMRNFYLFREAVNDTFYYKNLADYGSLIDDFILDGQYADLIPYGLFDYEMGDTIELYIHSLDQTGYDIYNALLTESEFKGGFFDSPSNNVPSNINGGARGLFLTHAINSKKIVITE